MMLEQFWLQHVQQHEPYPVGVIDDAHAPHSSPVSLLHKPRGHGCEFNSGTSSVIDLARQGFIAITTAETNERAR
eukprot:15481635-Alexandrium_andersonii.AAC.1